MNFSLLARTIFDRCLRFFTFSPLNFSTCTHGTQVLACLPSSSKEACHCLFWPLYILLLCKVVGLDTQKTSSALFERTVLPN